MRGLDRAIAELTNTNSTSQPTSVGKRDINADGAHDRHPATTLAPMRPPAPQMRTLPCKRSGQSCYPTGRTNPHHGHQRTDITFSARFSPAGACWMDRPLKKSFPGSPMNPASRNPAVISFQNINQSLRKVVRNVRPPRRQRGQALADAQMLGGDVVLMTALGLRGVPAHKSLQRGALQGFQ